MISRIYVQYTLVRRNDHTFHVSVFIMCTLTFLSFEAEFIF